MKNNWNRFLSTNQKGFYINKFGPFKNKETAEFFNFLAFGNPSDPLSENKSKLNIKYLEENLDRIHPKHMFQPKSIMWHWCRETFGVSLNEEIAIKIAASSGAKGYKSFSKWLIQGCLVDGNHISYKP